MIILTARTHQGPFGNIKLKIGLTCLTLVMGLYGGLQQKWNTAEARVFIAENNLSKNSSEYKKNSTQMYSDREPVKGEGECRLVDVATISHSNSNPWLFTLLNGNIMATFLVDTGSSYTVITPALARKLNITITGDTPKVSITTANGVVEVPIIMVQKIAIGRVEKKNIQVVIKDLGPDPLLGGLLGMNFFENTDLTIGHNKLTLCIHDE